MKLNNWTTIAISRRNKQRLRKLKRTSRGCHNLNDVLTILIDEWVDYDDYISFEEENTPIHPDIIAYPMKENKEE